MEAPYRIDSTASPSMYCITIQYPREPRQRKTRTSSYVVCASSAPWFDVVWIGIKAALISIGAVVVLAGCASPEQRAARARWESNCYASGQYVYGNQCVSRQQFNDLSRRDAAEQRAREAERADDRRRAEAERDRRAIKEAACIRAGRTWMGTYCW